MSKRNSNSRIRMERSRAKKRKVIAVFLAVCMVIVGFIIADASIIRHRIPAEEGGEAVTQVSGEETQQSAASFVATYVPSIALDNSVMLSSVLQEAKENDFSAIAFDIKRDNGTLGYASQLVVINTFGAVSAPAAKLHESLAALKKQNIGCIGRVSCLLDNLAPQKNSAMAVMNGEKVYTDEDGNTYLNPDSPEGYQYLLDIIGESKNLGLDTMILSHCTLPEEIGKEHNDGFENLSQRLKADLGGVTFYEGVDVQIKGWDAEQGEYNADGIRSDIEKLPELKEYQVYVITTRRDKSDVNEALNKAGIKRYVITDD